MGRINPTESAAKIDAKFVSLIDTPLVYIVTRLTTCPMDGLVLLYCLYIFNISVI